MQLFGLRRARPAEQLSPLFRAEHLLAVNTRDRLRWWSEREFLSILDKGLLKVPIVNRIASMQDEMTAWRREIHVHPETAFEKVGSSISSLRNSAALA